MAEVVHEVFLPYTPDELRSHFVHSDLKGEDPERHLKAWRSRVAEAPSKDPSFLHRDETLWTAGGLLALQTSHDYVDRWRTVLGRLFGPSRLPPSAWSGVTLSNLI